MCSENGITEMVAELLGSISKCFKKAESFLPQLSTLPSTLPVAASLESTGNG
jgi:hypothetical protein